ncbi:MAG TPA: CapA family protein [Gammaproteobacteria bacterium]|jgi:poly-gamma-glutamate synthesis protein (capsule biosynthesis protein)|nr:CapA family protein [Gammaproteobacteria bacterium]
MPTLFLTGDVMTGRGIDQVLPTPSDPQLYESYVRDARDYVQLAERAHGRIDKPVGFDYVWGDALAELERTAPDARIVNLETAVTTSPEPWPGKGINYRMHPANVGCLTAARLDCCMLANNHVLDWGYAGLAQTLATLHAAGLRTAGAGANEREATAPAVIDLGARGRVLVFAVGSVTSGVPYEWAATPGRAGVAVLADLSAGTAQRLAAAIALQRRPRDVVVVSVHWGSNWGYSVPDEQRAFAHALIDSGAVDVVHGHSSHHAKGFEIYRRRPIFYGCGDFVNDYEGIGGIEQRYRSDLALMYFVDLDAAAGVASIRMVPLAMRRFSLHKGTRADAQFMKTMLEREGRFEPRLEIGADNALTLRVITCC